MQNQLFWRKNDFECIFDRFEVKVVTVWSSRFGKKHKTLAFLLIVDFLRIFKITHFF